MNNQEIMDGNQEIVEMETNDEIVEQQVENEDDIFEQAENEDIVYLEQPAANNFNFDGANVNLDLPVEVWMIILGYVDPQDLPAVAQVNRKFSDLLNDPILWTHLRLKARKLIDQPKLYMDKICWYTWLRHLYLYGDRVPPAEAGKKQNWQVNMEDKVPEFLFRNVAQHCNRNISYYLLM